MNLYEIFYEIGSIDGRLALKAFPSACGYTASGEKPVHPADILDTIISDVFEKILMGEEITVRKEELSEVTAELDDFRQNYRIPELAGPIDKLKRYIRQPRYH